MYNTVIVLNKKFYFNNQGPSLWYVYTLNIRTGAQSFVSGVNVPGQVRHKLQIR